MPDIIIKIKKEKTCILFDVIISADTSVTEKEAENKIKYKILRIEIQRMLNMKCTNIPAVTGAAGILTKGLKKSS